MAPLSAGEESPLRRAERVFFVADVPAFVQEIWRMVRPGGRLAVTTWGRGWLEPASTVFSDTVREVRPELHKPFSPRDEITSPEALTALLAEGGVGDAVVVPAAGRQNLDHPEDFWEIVLGSGLRGTVDVLDARSARSSRRAWSTLCALLRSPTWASTRSSRRPRNRRRERAPPDVLVPG